MCSFFLELCPPKKYFEVKELKIKAMFMCVWLNYCDENNVERIAIAVKNINHLFHLASEIIEADSFICFCSLRRKPYLVAQYLINHENEAGHVKM